MLLLFYEKQIFECLIWYFMKQYFFYVVTLCNLQERIPVKIVSSRKLTPLNNSSTGHKISFKRQQLHQLHFMLT